MGGFLKRLRALFRKFRRREREREAEPEPQLEEFDIMGLPLQLRLEIWRCVAIRNEVFSANTRDIPGSPSSYKWASILARMNEGSDTLHEPLVKFLVNANNPRRRVLCLEFDVGAISDVRLGNALAMIKKRVLMIAPYIYGHRSPVPNEFCLAFAKLLRSVTPIPILLQYGETGTCLVESWDYTAAPDLADTSTLGAPYRKAVHPKNVAPPLTPAPDLKHEIMTLDGGQILHEKDIAVPMRDGIKIYVDAYRPISDIAEETPSIVLFSPFGKHGAVPREKFANMGVDFSKLSKYTQWELPDPLVWCAEYGYSLVIVDPRGTWWSEGEKAHYFSPEEGRDGYDLVEWVAKQSWCTGNVGWGAVSYFAMSIYQTAVLKPPHLKAIMPWEGISDIYREVNCPGGIPNVAFQQLWMDMTGNGLGHCEDHAVAAIEHPLYDAWWQSKVVDWSKIDIPAFSVTGWSSLGLHLRGTIEAWQQFSPKNKYLLIHGGREWSEYYQEYNIKRQKAFFDRYLKDIVNDVETWPRVQYSVRSSADNNVTVYGSTFPPASDLRQLYLGPSGRLVIDPTPSRGFVSFEAGQPGSQATFSYTFSERTEITGYASVKLLVQALRFPDVDLYVALQKLDRDGKEVKFWHSTQQVEASASFGWLRVSHRELDQERSSPGRPRHTHQRRQWLRPSDIVEAEVEIWPTSTVWEAGESLCLAIRGAAFTDAGNPTQIKGPNHGFGEVRIWFEGGSSGLFLPFTLCSGEDACSPSLSTRLRSILTNHSICANTNVFVRSDTIIVPAILTTHFVKIGCTVEVTLSNNVHIDRAPRTEEKKKSQYENENGDRWLQYPTAPWKTDEVVTVNLQISIAQRLQFSLVAYINEWRL
ncbi:CocE/NonD family Hydrolase [Seiridium cupressi]